MARMTIAQKRRCALGVLNYNNRHAPRLLTWDEAQRALDDFARREPDTVAAWFWHNASDYQINLLRRDYNRSIKE